MSAICVQVIRPGGRVVTSGDGKRRRGHPRQLGHEVVVGDRLARGGVPLGRRVRDHPLERVGLVRVRRGVAGREPSPDDRRGDGGRAVGTHECRPVEPALPRTELRRRAQDGQAAHPLRVVDGHLEPDHPPERQPDDVDALEASCVEHLDDVLGEVGDRARAGSDGRVAVATQVDADHLVVTRQRRHLRIPHPMVGAQ